MTEESANKTEDPTTHRLEEARKQGQTAFSKEVLHWVVLFSSMVLLIFIFPFSSQFLYKNLIPFLSQVHDTNVSFAQLQ
ncbi:MAG: EscU/YscU/HrcU family type III secretion system export apparatus switch protein, partial [Proteobacteria bacterium]|nr:EscU/YscU/HrcU family type III secretion system export apparatus switch protein [Pseudomonadota bacterium]